MEGEENLYAKIGNHTPAKAKAMAGNITFPLFMGSRGLVPLRGVGQRPTNPWRKQEARCARARVHDPAKAKAMAGNITFSPFMGSRGLVPLRGLGQRSTSSWRKQEARSWR